jgi:hypothetical protein
MDWANLIDPVKSTQSNPKKWIGSDKWVNIDFKNEKPIKKKIWVPGKAGLSSKNLLTH